MKYRTDKAGEKLSILGYGCMRFSRKGNAIDLDKTEKEILLAIKNGVNYFDTAYIYPGSEEALGKILARTGMRDKVNIATKLPQYLIRSRAAVDKYFNEEKSRLQTDHIDYYLMHMLTDLEAWRKLQDVGIEQWIDEKKKSGEIRNIGFSFHGNTDMFLKILDAYDWDFCQIQYNYMDEHSQAGRKGLEAAAAKGIPVLIMEPLRGGKLVTLLPEKAKRRIAQENGNKNPAPAPAKSGRRSGAAEGYETAAAALAFRWLWNQPEVTCVLSGMNSVQMVEENCRTASESEPGCLSEEEKTLIEEVKTLINEKLKVPCTGCGYCMTCPKGVDIPGAFRCYNEMSMEGKGVGRHEYFQVVGLRKEPALPTQCVGCGRCEKHCPQHISIIEELKKAKKALLPFPYRAAIAVGRKVVTHRSK